MIKAIFYKESIKTRRITLLSIILALVLLGYMWLTTSEIFRSNGAVEIWNSAIGGKFDVISLWLYLYPVVVALMIGALQFTSETTDKRLKLTLHLPYSETKIISSLYAFGLRNITVLSGGFFLVLYIILSHYYPSEIIAVSALRFLGYFLLALGVYFALAWIIVEPIWKKRIIGGVAAFAILSFFYDLAPSPLAIVLFVLVDILLVFAAFNAVLRFKDGAQK
ncbi:MAG: ABC transporter permease [Rikenellaceae bacterium]